MSTNTSGSLTNEQKAVYYGTVAAELARVKAERDKLIEQSMELADEAVLRDQNAALRARVAELEEKAERYRLTTLRQDARIAELVAALRETLEAPDSTISGTLYYRMEHILARSESPACQNATNGGQISSESGAPAKEAPTYFVPPEQLLPAYRGDMPAKHPLQTILDSPEHGIPVDVGSIIDGTPAKHPDTERLDWLENNWRYFGHFAELNVIGEPLRDAIDNAMQNG